MRDRCQPESTITFDEYIYYRLDKSRIIAGRKVMNKNKDELQKLFNINLYLIYERDKYNYWLKYNKEMDVTFAYYYRYYNNNRSETNT